MDSFITLHCFSSFSQKTPSYAQSLDDKTTARETSAEQEVNVGFNDAVSEYQLAIGYGLQDETFTHHKNMGDDLSTFMSRPIRIFSKVWEVNESPNYFDVFNPWELFLSNSQVTNKIETFKLMNGLLHLKFMINGSPFHYGRMFVGVRPSKYDNNNTTIDPVTPQTVINYRDEYNAGVKTLNALATLYSQRPHVFLDPSTNQPQELIWPFFSQNNFIDITNNETVNRMGRIEIWELSKLQQSNGGTDPVEISCFAWLTDVVFAGLTAASVSVAQSSDGAYKSKKDKAKLNLNNGSVNTGEYAPNGLISGPASTLASYARYFTEIPYIGKYAKATSMVANAVSDVAKIFGFSKPPILSDIVVMRPTPIQELANYSGSEFVFKLSLDPKQELSVDPRTVGLTPEDQMSFGYLTKREAYIDTFHWRTVGNNSTGLLYSLRVNPSVAPVIQLGAGSDDCFLQTPVSFVARPFKSWSGSLKYRFQIVASQMHRGRLLFVYEPTPSTTGTVSQTNNRFSHVVDITQDRDVTFEVNYTQFRPYLDVIISENVNDWAIEGPLGSMADAFNNQRCNGRIDVYVINTLAAPTDTSTVDVNVFISAGDSFEVKNPAYDIGFEYAYARADVAVGPPSNSQSFEGHTSTENMPENPSAIVLNGMQHPLDLHQSDVFYGEMIVSFRSLLKRYCYHRTLITQQTAASSSYAIQEFNLYNYPVGPGPSYGSSIGSALTPISGPVAYNICALTYIRYVMSAYVGVRGAIRWKYVSTRAVAPAGIISVTRRTDILGAEATLNYVLIDSTTNNGAVNQNSLLTNGLPGMVAGAAITMANVNPCLDVELPYQSEYRYAEVSEIFASTGPNNVYQTLRRQNHILDFQVSLNTTAAFWPIQTFCATAEDFSCFFFIGAPPLFYADTRTVTPAV